MSGWKEKKAAYTCRFYSGSKSTRTHACADQIISCANNNICLPFAWRKLHLHAKEMKPAYVGFFPPDLARAGGDAGNRFGGFKFKCTLKQGVLVPPVPAACCCYVCVCHSAVGGGTANAPLAALYMTKSPHLPARTTPLHRAICNKEEEGL